MVVVVVVVVVIITPIFLFDSVSHQEPKNDIYTKAAIWTIYQAVPNRKQIFSSEVIQESLIKELFTKMFRKRNEGLVAFSRAKTARSHSYPKPGGVAGRGGGKNQNPERGASVLGEELLAGFVTFERTMVPNGARLKE